MTQAELYNELKSLGLPLAYSHFKEEVSPPYLTYTFAYSNDLVADDKNYKSIDNFKIELYTDKKDLVSEGLVQEKLKELHMPYRKLETFIDTENMFQILYQITLI